MMDQFPNHILNANALEAIRGSRLLFQGLDLTLSAGKALRVEGANGIGKTTLLRMVSGLAFISEGEVQWNGVPITQCRSEFNTSLHYFGHQTALKLALTPIENLRFLQLFYGEEQNDPVIQQALQLMDLEQQAEIPCHALSAGQKQRASLARLLAVKKSLWILDEPFTALDSTIIERFKTLMKEHLANNGMIIMTTHQDINDIDLHYESLVLNGVSNL